MSWPLNSGEIISGLGAVIAFSAMIVTLWFARGNLKLQIAATELKYFEDFQKWADQLADTLTEAEHLCDLDPRLTKAKRKFVGQVQRILDPTSRRIFFDRIRDKAALVDQRAAR